jgi:hypothetical protein
VGWRWKRDKDLTDKEIRTYAKRIVLGGLFMLIAGSIGLVVAVL